MPQSVIRNHRTWRSVLCYVCQIILLLQFSSSLSLIGFGIGSYTIMVIHCGSHHKIWYCGDLVWWYNKTEGSEERKISALLMIEWIMNWMVTAVLWSEESRFNSTLYFDQLLIVTRVSHTWMLLRYYPQLAMILFLWFQWL